jgi:hypothetical protein
MKIRTSLAIVSLILPLGASAPAALTWENTEADLHPALTDKEAVAHFKYKNTGEKPVKIMSVHPSCGCTTAALTKDVVAPNESGEITATFHLGDRFAVQTKTITVATDDQVDAPTILRLKATIPRLLEITPMFVYWAPGQPLEPKTITAKLGADFPVTKLTVTSTDPAVATEVVPVPKEKSFRIVVTPKQSGRPINAALKIEPDFPKDAPKAFYVNVRVDSRAAAVKK